MMKVHQQWWLSLLVLVILHGFVGVVTSSSSSSSPEEQGCIVPGIRKEYLPQPIFYEGYIPLIMEYQTPQWNKTDITFNNWYTCVSETYPYRYSCPVVFHMNNAVVNLHADFEGLHPVVDDDEDKNPGALENSHVYWDRLLMSSDFCERIQPHFSGIYVREEELERYLEALKQCRIEWGTGKEGVVFMQRNLSDYNYSVREPFTRMENNFFSTFFQKVVSTNKADQNKGQGQGNSTTVLHTDTTTPIAQPVVALDPAVNVRIDLMASAMLSNTRTIMQAGILEFYYAEKNRWIHATSDCLQKLVPQSIVTKGKFKEALRNITYALRGDNTHQLSIGDEMISKYYSIPITDCSHTSKGKMAIRIQIPILKKNRSKTLQLVQTHILPFEYKGHVCNIKLDSSSSTEESQFSGSKSSAEPPQSFLYEELNGLAFPTKCRGNELCHISEYDLMIRSNADPCASALMAMNHSIIKNYCHFQCRKKYLFETPIVTRVHPNQYVVTGSPLTIRIDCTSVNGITKGTEYFIDPHHVGAHLVNVPCKCLMTIDKLKSLKFYGEGGCHLTEDDDFFKRTRTNYFHPEGKVKYPEVIPIIPFHFARTKQDNKDKDNHGGTFYYENISPDSRVNLADFLDLERIEGYLETMKVKDPLVVPSAASSMSMSQVLQEDGGGSCSSLTILWTLFVIFTTIILGIQGYIIYMLRRNVGSLYPKDERIFYKVPDSPVI